MNRKHSQGRRRHRCPYEGSPGNIDDVGERTSEKEKREWVRQSEQEWTWAPIKDAMKGHMPLSGSGR